MIFEEKNIKVLLIEDEEFDVRRVKNTISPFSSRIKIVETFSNGKAAVEFLQSNKGDVDIVIMDYQIAGGLMGESLIQKIKDLEKELLFQKYKDKVGEIITGEVYQILPNKEVLVLDA
ncbi:MAG: response regulator, partial [Ignavibacterium sp.]